MLSFPHALAHAVAAPSRSGSPGAQVVSRQRLSICGTERQDILQHQNSCESFVVEARKGTSSGTFLPQKRGAAVISPTTPSPACISITCAKQGCRIRHTGPVQRGQFGLLRPFAVSGFQLSLQSTRSHASDRKAAHDTKLSLPKFFLQKAALSIRAGQGSSQTSATPRLVAQSRCQRSVLTCPVTPSYSALPQLPPGAPGVIRGCCRPHRPGSSSARSLLGAAPRLSGPISSGGENVRNAAVRIHQLTLYLDQGHQGLGSSNESEWDTLSLAHRRLSARLPSRPLALLARKTVEDLFVRSGLTRAPDKGVWVPTQTLPDHLGVEITTASATGWIKVPHRRCQELARSAKDILCQSAKGARRVPSDLLVHS